MKKLFITGLICIIATFSIHLQAMEQQREIENNLITVILANDQEVQISSEAFNQLKEQSGTIQGMWEDADDTSAIGAILPNIDRQTFDLIVQVANQSPDALSDHLTNYTDQQLANFINAANNLAAEKLLAIGIKAFAQQAFSDNHLNQLLTKDNFQAYYKQFNFSAEMDNAIAQHIEKELIDRHIEETGIRVDKTRDYFSPACITELSYITSMESYPQYNIRESDDGTVYICNKETDERIRILEGHMLKDDKGFICYLCNYYCAGVVTPDNQYAITGSDDGSVRIWDIKTGQSVHKLKGHQYEAPIVAVSLDSQYVVTCDNTMIRIWDIKTGKLSHIFESHQDTINAIAISPDSQYVITGAYYDCTACIWNMQTGKLLCTLEYPIPIVSYVEAINITLDSQYITVIFNEGMTGVWQFIDPLFQKAIHNLTLEQAQIIVMLMTDKISLTTMPQHLQEIYNAIPDVLKSLLEQ